MPWNAIVFLFNLFDHALQPTVGEGVVLIEVKVTLVSEETSSIFWFDVPDPIGRDNRGRDVDEVFPPRLQLNALVPHSWELSWSAYE